MGTCKVSGLDDFNATLTEKKVLEMARGEIPLCKGLFSVPIQSTEIL